MESVVKGFLGIFFLCLIVVLGIGILTLTMDAYAARQKFSDYCKRIEQSCFDEEVVKECKKEAQDNNMELSVTAIKREGESFVSYGWGQLTYRLCIESIGFEKEMSLYSDLR